MDVQFIRLLPRYSGNMFAVSTPPSLIHVISWYLDILSLLHKGVWSGFPQAKMNLLWIWPLRRIGNGEYPALMWSRVEIEVAIESTSGGNELQFDYITGCCDHENFVTSGLQ
jgi:hypothetical protein